MVIVSDTFYDSIIYGTLQHRQSPLMGHIVPVAFELRKGECTPS